MQIIQGIRDKGAAVAIIVIAICLVGFILMDAKSGSNTSMFGGGNSSSIGKINGKTIELSDFNKRVDAEKNKEAGRTGQEPSGAALERIRDQVWNQIVAENVFYKETDKLGITLTSKELSAILASDDQSNPFMQEKGMMGADGKLDPQKVSEAITNIKKAKGDQLEAVTSQILEPLKLSTAAAKYGGMISASAYYPTWMKERDAADAKSFAVISYVGVPYTEISDSTVKVTDDEINSYVGKRKTMFKQEAGRTVSYITFSQFPSAADSIATSESVASLKESFVTDTSSKTFLSRNGSATDFKDDYTPSSKLGDRLRDTISKLAVGSVYGPYVDNGNFVLAKMISTRQLPDSVTAKHILIGTIDPQTQQPTRSDSSAKALADSVLAAIKGGASFAEMVKKYSDDKGSVENGGEYKGITYNQMVPEFNEFIFTKLVGSMDVVRTQFGYHIINVEKQENFKPAYKIAYFSRKILASDETINNANLAAARASSNKTAKELADYAQKNGLQIVTLPTLIKENDYTVGTMQDARSLVRWAFDNKKGAVSDPPLVIGDNFVVATVNKIFEEGTQGAEEARQMAEAAVRNQKKADLIIAKMGNTIESAASAFHKQIAEAGADSTITMSAQIINGIGAEPKVIGAAFNKENQTKPSAPIAGTAGVYVIKVNSIQAKLPETPEQTGAQATARFAAIRQQSNNWFEALRKAAEIRDQRSKFF